MSNTDSSHAGFREFIVEFLGSLVPGVAFLCACVPAIIIPISVVATTYFASVSLHIPKVLETMPTNVGTLMFLLFPALMAFFVFAYIAGHLFFRQTPKLPDQKSFERNSKRKEKQEGMVRTTTKDGKLFLNDDGSPRVEFPYHFLKTYLSERGLTYLAQRVTWDENQFSSRCKHFVNALKLRIHAVSPEHFQIIARNEAHVRLSSSMWYVCRTLIQMSAAGIIFFISYVAISKNFPDKFPELPLRHIALMFPSCVMIASWLTKYSIECALHYQREREVLFILETADWLQKCHSAKDIFDGLKSETN